MTQEEITKEFKFYHGENDCPYAKDTDNALFWDIESYFASIIKNQGDLDGWVEITSNSRDAFYDYFVDSHNLTKAGFVVATFVQSCLDRRRYDDDKTIIYLVA